MFCLCLIKHLTTQTCGKLAAELDGGECSDSRPDRFIPGKRDPGTH
jgi:hypothetical protein